MDWDKDVGVAGRKRRGRLGVSYTFDKFDFDGFITYEDEAVATFSAVEHGGFESTRRFSSPCFSHCQELATTEGSQAVELRYGLRGVRVGEASHPGPHRRRISRPVEGRDVIPRMYFHGSTQVDEDSDVADATQVLQRPRRGGRRVSSDSDVPLVMGSRFAVLTESDDQSDIEPLMCPAGQTRDEDDVNTVPASSGAVAAQLGAISGMSGNLFRFLPFPESVFQSASLI